MKFGQQCEIGQKRAVCTVCTVKSYLWVHGGYMWVQGGAIYQTLPLGSKSSIFSLNRSKTMIVRFHFVWISSENIEMKTEDKEHRRRLLPSTSPPTTI